MAEKIFLCRSDEMSDGTMRQVQRRGSDDELAVYKVGGSFYATDSLCTHGLVSLVDGDLEGPIVYCPLHGGAFDVRTGRAVERPCSTPLKTYEVIVESDKVYCLYGD